MGISAGELLRAWEACIDMHPAERALYLLASANPESKEELCKICIGKRDALLLALQEEIFGGILHSTAVCPECGQMLDLEFRSSDISSSREADPAEEISLRFDGFEIRFRLLRAGDLLEISASSDENSARDMLLEMCILDVRKDGSYTAWNDLPPEAVKAVEERMALADPGGVTLMDIRCPDCEQSWTEVFDIVSFLWREIDAWAKKTLREIHIIASAYGWSEDEILSLSPLRRRIYLEIMGA
jgi:hypothetical protein